MCICCRGKAFHYQDEDLDWAKEVDALHFPHDYWSMVYDPHLVRENLRNLQCCTAVPMDFRFHCFKLVTKWVA
jgi:hypothetical protein